MAEIFPNAKKRVLSGMRPTGKLHLGNYMGALHNWVKLQNELDENGQPKYECYFFIADWHALTTDYANTGQIKQNTLDVALDFLAAGLDPRKSTIFIQSHVPQHAELHLLLSMITPLSWLERVPSYKDQQEQLREKDLTTYGFLGYPLLQSADILLYQPQFVPVGQDQVAHVEITREIARRFNHFYPAESLILPEPQALLTPSPKLPGTDGRKMSKSYGNTILLSDPLNLVREKLEKMTNGGQRLHVTDPGDPEICPVADLHRIFSPQEVDAEIRSKCRNAQFSCLDCKHCLYNSMIAQLEPIHLKRSQFEFDLAGTWGLLLDGAEKARERAEQTMKEVRSAIGITFDTSGLHNTTILIETFKQDAEVKYRFPERERLLGLPAREQNTRLTQSWLSISLPNSIPLTVLEGTVYLAPRNRRVFVLSSVANFTDRWTFLIKRKSYEVLVLLCADQSILLPDDDSFALLDFVIPQKAYRMQWSQIEKAVKEIAVEISRIGGQYLLHIASADPINITAFLGNYEALR